ncbi:MAG: hypothetical protein NC221_07365 [Duncaniella sp.]|nr:hypothetical protein [Duncaniella sp.]
MELFKPIKRWWRSKGFGIHSPFAFYFILRVLREKLPYYAYSEILRLNPTKVSHRNLLTLFRIICHFSPAQATLPEESPKELRKTIVLADSRIHLTEKPSNFQCYIGSETESHNEQIYKVVKNEGVIVILHPTAESLKIKKQMTSGMTFINSDRSMFIAVTRHDLPRQDFEINF